MLNLQITPQQKAYELIDSGDGEKFERFGPYTFVRPEPQAMWFKRLSEEEWQKADAIYARSGRDGQWVFNTKLPASWTIELCGLKLIIKPTSFKHLGVFPEQMSNWQWFGDLIKKSKREISVLNLFGYTGAASLFAAKCGAEVCHVDASKKAVEWGKENAVASGLQDKKIRWIVDDALKFTAREIRRGRKYDAIIMDPPVYGHGPSGESWKLEKDFYLLMKNCRELLSDQPLFILLNGYVMGYSAISYQNALQSVVDNKKGNMEIGELTIKEEKSERLLPAGIFVRWSNC
ncbi:MAG: class I SAM-dependent methyltransferase [Patescibacteria group bacterium]